MLWSGKEKMEKRKKKEEWKMSKSNCRNNKILSWKISPISNTIYSLKNKKSSYLEIQLIVLNNIPVFSYYTLLICAELDLNFFWHKEVFRLGVKFELQLSAYTTVTATATQNPSHVCNLHHSSQQCQILNTLSEARDWTHISMDTSSGSFLLNHSRNSGS